MKLQNIILFVIILTFTGCSNEPYWPDTNVENGVRYSKFDFRSTFECDVTFSLEQREFVYIYTQDPSKNPHAEAVRTLWTDQSGAYRCNLTLPTALIGQPIYAVTSYGTYTAEVTEKGVSFKGGSRGTKSATAHGDLHPDVKLCLSLKDAYRARMDRYNPNNLSKLVETGEIAIHTKEDNTQVLFTFLHSLGWNSNFMYYYYYKGEDPINSDNKDAYIKKICEDKDGRFLCTRGWGIQVNKKGNNANSPMDDDVTILTTKGVGGINLRFCDIAGDNQGNVETDIDGNPIWTPSEYLEKDARSEKTVKSMIGISNHLYFYGDIDLNSDTYEYSCEDEMPFPKGYKIGLILKSVKHTQRENLSNPDPTLVNYFFTNPNLNEPDYYGNQIHAGRFWTSEEANNFSRFVYGFEDSFRTGKSNEGTDCNFTDFLCMVSTDPIANIADVMSLSATYSAVSGTLLFEDMFPDQGDYDMNDVIVEYRKVKEYEKRTANGVEADRIKNFYVELTPVHCGARYDDYIYVNVEAKSLLKEPVLIDFKAACGMDLKSVAAYNESQIVSGNANDLITVRFDIVNNWRPYNQPDRNVAFTDDDVPYSAMDVFLYVKSTNREVHITGNHCAGVNDSSNEDLDENLKNYFAPQTEDGIFLPWAIDIPIKSDGHGYRGFIPVTESVRITEEYLPFLDWYNGDKRKAWYENKYHTPKGK